MAINRQFVQNGAFCCISPIMGPFRAQMGLFRVDIAHLGDKSPICARTALQISQNCQLANFGDFSGFLVISRPQLPWWAPGGTHWRHCGLVSVARWAPFASASGPQGAYLASHWSQDGPHGPYCSLVARICGPSGPLLLVPPPSRLENSPFGAIRSPDTPGGPKGPLIITHTGPKGPLHACSWASRR